MKENQYPTPKTEDELNKLERTETEKQAQLLADKENKEKYGTGLTGSANKFIKTNIFGDRPTTKVDILQAQANLENSLIEQEKLNKIREEIEKNNKNRLLQKVLELKEKYAGNPGQQLALSSIEYLKNEYADDAIKILDELEKCELTPWDIQERIEQMEPRNVQRIINDMEPYSYRHRNIFIEVGTRLIEEKQKQIFKEYGLLPWAAQKIISKDYYPNRRGLNALTEIEVGRKLIEEKQQEILKKKSMK